MRAKKKIISLLLSICLTASLLPTTAIANEGNKTGAGTASSSTELTTVNEIGSKEVKGSESGTKSKSGTETKSGTESKSGTETKSGTESESGTETKTGTESESGAETKTGTESESGTDKKVSAATAAVQDLIDALPDAETITQENVALVKEQLEAIEQARELLSAEEQALLDCTRYQTVKDTILALENIENTVLLNGETGDLTVQEGVLGTDYTYAEHILTILTDKEMTISGTAQEDRILIRGGYPRR